MATSLLLEVLFVLALLLTNGLFAGAEIAVLSVRKSRFQQLADEGSGGAGAVVKLREQPEQLLATLQIGITVVGTAAAALGGKVLSADVAALVKDLPTVGPYLEKGALLLVVALISYLELVVGELVPKSIALRHGETYGTLMGRPLLAMSWVLRPVVWFLTRSSNLLLRPFGDHTTFTEARMSPDELQQLVEESAKSGALDSKAGEIASRALEFAGLNVADVMVPRNEIVAVPKSAKPDDIRDLLLEKGHARMPVFSGSLDDIQGYITAKDVLSLAWDHQLIVLQDLIRPAYFVPASMQASRLLQELKRRNVRLAIVVDEHGGTAGLVTLEDLVAELVGQVANEDGPDEQLVVRQPDGSVLISGTAPLREVNRLLELEFEEGDGYATLAGFFIARLGGIPVKGQRLEVAGTTLEVVEATPRQVKQLRVRTARPLAEAAISGTHQRVQGTKSPTGQP